MGRVIAYHKKVIDNVRGITRGDGGGGIPSAIFKGVQIKGFGMLSSYKTG